jgi:DUF177 domain-containing protein
MSDGMKVVFGQISAGATHYSIKDTGWFPVEDFVLREFRHAEIDLLKKDNETVLLQGDLLATVGFLCDRCGESFDYTLSCDFYYLFKTGEDSSLHLDEVECSEEDFNTVYLDEPVIDISEVLREQVLLAVPERKVCNEDCKGLCPGCGAALKYEACRCGSVPSDSPFAVLKNLKKH